MSSSGCDSGISPTRSQSSPFSISDILSKDTGQKKSPPSSHAVPFSTPGSSRTPGSSKGPVHSMLDQESTNKMKYSSIDTPKRPRKGSSSHAPTRNPKITMSEAGTLMASCSVPGHCDNLTLQGPRVAHVVTPHKPLRSSQMNSSLISPFNANILQALGQRPSPSSEEKEELFGESSLGMLSEVAQLHSELSEAEANSSLEAPVRERLANIRLVNSMDCSNGPHEASKGEACNASLIAGRYRTASTPSILKRDKKRKRALSAPQSSSDESSSSGSARYPLGHLNTGFLSPLADEKSPSLSNKELTFSPSIFLSRPNLTHSISSPGSNPTRSPTSSIPVPKSETSAIPVPIRGLASRFSISPGSESDCMHSSSLSDTTDNDSASFATSTPIKCGKENHARSNNEEAWSPTILLNKRQRRLKEPNEASTGSESDTTKRPRLSGPRRKKSKARTKLSPLLENACSPISKDSGPLHHPSPLTTALATTPTRGVSEAYHHHHHHHHQVSAPNTSHLRVGLAATTSHLVMAPPALPPQALPISSCPPHPGPTYIRGGGFPAAGKQGSTSLGQTLLNAATASPITLNRHFPASSALLPLPPTQIPQPRQNLLLQAHHNPLRLQSPFAYNPLAAACSNSFSAHSSITAGGIQGYFPFVSLVAPPTNPAAYLSPYPPDTHFVSMNSSGGGGGDASGRNCSQLVFDEGRRDAKQMKSVPPWFIFSNNRSEKRSRLTEAINKSLSETPSQSQTTKLPAEWTKLACGQTNDQKQLTEKARLFMQYRPRQLTFSDDMD